MGGQTLHTAFNAMGRQMDLIRPELRARFWRYRDVIAGGFVTIFGAGWAVSSVGFMVILGTSMSIAGSLLIFAGLQRARFRAVSHGAGLISLDEGQVTYFGPFGGGATHIDNLVQVDLSPPEAPDEAPDWLLLSSNGEALRIPVNAEGADLLFDVFAKLPDMQTERMLRLLKNPPKDHVAVWRAAGVLAD